MNLQLGTRLVKLRLSERAHVQLARETGPLDIEMELYFSYLLRKRVYFRATPCPDCVARTNLTEHVSVSFRPVMTRDCSIDEVEDEPDVETVALVRTAAFMPKWLELDYDRGSWPGDFGF